MKPRRAIDSPPLISSISLGRQHDVPLALQIDDAREARTTAASNLQELTVPNQPTLPEAKPILEVSARFFRSTSPDRPDLDEASPPLLHELLHAAEPAYREQIGAARSEMRVRICRVSLGAIK